MKRPTRLGTDDAGYVINQTSIRHVQPEFESVLFKAIELVKEAFDEQLHSIYLYGSIGRGTAVAGQSDLDLTVLVHEDVGYDRIGGADGAIANATSGSH